MPTETIDLDADDEDSIQPNGAPPHLSPSSDLELAEILEPTVDIQAKFKHYNEKHFSNRITNTTVEYSTRMTLCAGTCTFRPPKIRIALSEPLLKLRPRSDLLSTLLHEMIHAFLFLVKGFARDGPDGHGPAFMFHARRINAAEPAVNITPYHEFRDEVDHYRVHHWRCEKCHDLIKRAMNRAPAPTDQLWPVHQNRCGGAYVKIAGPPNKEKPPKPPRHRAIAVAATGSEHVPKGVMKTFRIDDMLSGRTGRKSAVKMASCPVCAASVKEDEMNEHLDLCLAESLATQSSNAIPAESKGKMNPKPTNVTKDQPRSKESEKTNNTVSSAKDDTFSKPVAAQNRPNFRQQNGGLNTFTKSSSREPFDVMKYVADPDALHDLALNPKKFQPEHVDKILSGLPPYTSKPNQTAPENGIKDFLHSLVHPESPSSRELQAKAIINPLTLDSDDEEFSFHALSERWGMSLTDIWELIHQKSVTDELGRTLLSAELIDMLSAHHPPKPKLRESTTPLKRPRSSTGSAKDCYKEVNQNTKTISGEVRSDPVHGNQTEANPRPHSRYDISPERSHGNRCPICDQIVGKVELDKHIRGCLVGSEETQDQQTNETPVGEPERIKHSSSDTARSKAKSGNVTSRKRQRCPICDAALSRQDLEKHVATCMLSTGLADAF